MNRAFQYVGSVLLTLLLTFALLGTTLLGLVQCKALQASTCTRLVAELQLPQRVYDRLQAEYKEQENTSGIPASVYMDSISVEQLSTIMTDSIQQAFAYLHGDADTVKVSADFTKLQQTMTTFFADYATENAFAQDATYDRILANAIASAEANILTNADVFRFGTLYDANVLPKARAAVPWVMRGLVAMAAVTVLLLLALALLHRKHLRQLLYWYGSACLCGSLLLLLPMAWVNTTHWFDRFTVKSDQIFAAVTGYLYGLTDAAIVLSIIGLVLAVLLLAGFAVWQAMAARKQPQST